MINLGKWRWPVLALVPCGILAGLFQLNVVRVDFESGSVVAYKGNLKQLPKIPGARVEREDRSSVRLIGIGTTPSRAVRSAEGAAAELSRQSIDLKKAEIQRKITALTNRQNKLTAVLTALHDERVSASKGSRRAWTPQMAARLNEARGRHMALKTSWPTHTDIPVLAQEIKSLEAIQRGQTKTDPNRIGKLSQKVTEARVESSLLGVKIRVLEKAAQTLQSDWTVVKPAARPQWPARIPGWPIAAGSVFVVVAAGFFLSRGSLVGKAVPFAANVPLDRIPLALAAEDSGPLPDDPLSRKAAGLYERWLNLVKRVYATGPEAPKDIYAGAEPLFKETVAFLGEGQDVLTRHLARVVIPGDLCSHVARTVLMALMGAAEAGASTAQQQGMTFAALFHDLAVAPRPADAWSEIGSEVGRLSTAVLRKIPGVPAPLLAMVEEILIAMDEYPLDTWQNVPRSQQVASFAKLLGHIDRFDKVLQKQKTRLNRRALIA